MLNLSRLSFANQSDGKGQNCHFAKYQDHNENELSYCGCQISHTSCSPDACMRVFLCLSSLALTTNVEFYCVIFILIFNLRTRKSSLLLSIASRQLGGEAFHHGHLYTLEQTGSHSRMHTNLSHRFKLTCPSSDCGRKPEWLTRSLHRHQTHFQ